MPAPTSEACFGVSTPTPTKVVCQREGNMILGRGARSDKDGTTKTEQKEPQGRREGPLRVPLSWQSRAGLENLAVLHCSRKKILGTQWVLTNQHQVEPHLEQAWSCQDGHWQLPLPRG